MWQLVPASPTWTIIKTKIKYDLIFNQAVSDKQYKIIKFLIYIYLYNFLPKKILLHRNNRVDQCNHSILCTTKCTEE